MSRNVRVFNEDYISDNVNLLDGKAGPIFIILGKEDKKIVDEIKKDEQLLSEKKAKLKQNTDEKESLKSQKDNKFTDIASTIGLNTSGTTARTYRRPNAEAEFQQLSAKALLEEPEIEKHKLTLQQAEEPPVPELTVPKLKYQEEELELGDFFEKVIVEGKNLCVQTADSITIERLIQNDDISKWVEEGIALHEKHKSNICEYCNQLILDERKVELANHFNEADKKLKNSIDDLLKKLRKAYTLIEGIKPVDKANLYKEIRTEYQSSTQTYGDAKQNILKKIVELGESLKEKKSKTTESVKLEINIDINPFITAIEQVNVEIRKHNTKTTNFQTEKKTAQEKLEHHYLSTIYDEVKYLEKEIDVKESLIHTLENGDPANPNELGIRKLGIKIDENKAKISSSHKACKVINEGLRTFLGRDEIIFEVAREGKEGYVIKRNGEIAYNLSEGEQNAIALVYFVVHLQDQDFGIKEGIGMILTRRI